MLPSLLAAQRALQIRAAAFLYRLDPPVCPHLRKGDAALVTMHHLGACTLTVSPRRSDSVFFEIFSYHAGPILALAVTTCPVVDTCSLVTSRYGYSAQAPHALRCGSLRLSHDGDARQLQHLDPFAACASRLCAPCMHSRHIDRIYVLLNSEHLSLRLTSTEMPSADPCLPRAHGALVPSRGDGAPERTRPAENEGSCGKKSDRKLFATALHGRGQTGSQWWEAWTS